MLIDNIRVFIKNISQELSNAIEQNDEHSDSERVLMGDIPSELREALRKNPNKQITKLVEWL